MGMCECEGPDCGEWRAAHGHYTRGEALSEVDRQLSEIIGLRLEQALAHLRDRGDVNGIVRFYPASRAFSLCSMGFLSRRDRWFNVTGTIGIPEGKCRKWWVDCYRILEVPEGKMWSSAWAVWVPVGPEDNEWLN